MYNVGSTSANEPVKVKFNLPGLTPEAGMRIVSVSDRFAEEFGIAAWDCEIAGDRQSVACTGPELAEYNLPMPIGPGETACGKFSEEEIGSPLPCSILVNADAESRLRPYETIYPNAEITGGGDPTRDFTFDPTESWRDFDITKFDGFITDSLGDPYNQAGGNPFEATSELEITATNSGTGFTYDIGEGTLLNQTPTRLPKSVGIDLPPGFVGNPRVAERCTEAQLAIGECTGDSQVGTIDLVGQDNFSVTYPVYNMVAPAGQAGELAFSVEVTWAHMDVSVRSEAALALTVTVENLNQTVGLVGLALNIWGVPAAAVHDDERLCTNPVVVGCASTLPEGAFLSLPTSCEGPFEIGGRVDSWLEPGHFLSAAYPSHDLIGSPIGSEGCSALDFSPSVEARPSSNAADAPTGLNVSVRTPQNADPHGTAEAHLRSIEVTLPRGLVVNPGGANGLAGCSPEQIGLLTAPRVSPVRFGADAPACPDASKIGTAELVTPLVDHPIPGSIYMALPGRNPFGSLLAAYLTAEDARSGLLIKMPLEIELDPETGQVRAVIRDAPQLPFERVGIDLKSGAGAPLRTPAVCGRYSSSAVVTPWSAPESGPPSNLVDTHTISQGAIGKPCQYRASDQPNAPVLEAGSVAAVAGRTSPFVLNLRREAASQEFRSFELLAPPGLTASLSGVAPCSSGVLAQLESMPGGSQGVAGQPACPSGSRLGSVSIAAGAGPRPFYVSGSVYLSGPYRDAPLSLAFVVPAVAGPYDLGTVVTRIAVYVEPATARLRLVSDAMPTVLSGIPLDITRISITLDRTAFSRNPTSCDVMEIGGSVTSVEGDVAPISNRFQVGDCGELRFAPRLRFRLTGAVGRNGRPGLSVVLVPRAGDAKSGHRDHCDPRRGAHRPKQLPGHLHARRLRRP